MENKRVYDNRTEWRNDKCQRHREDGPAIEYADGYKEWFIKGKRHREDGPAIEWSSGSKEWWVNGLRHREDGPACEDVDGDKVWYQNHQLHRLDGPAIDWIEYKGWFIKGKEYTEDEFNNYINEK